jgi:Cu+-exporting ATPase
VSLCVFQKCRQRTLHKSENYETGAANVDRTLTYKLCCFFCFAICSCHSPEYFDVNEFWLDPISPSDGLFLHYHFRFFYSASGYYVSAYKKVSKLKMLIDILIALGIIIMFIRSTIDIVFNYGSDFLIV